MSNHSDIVGRVNEILENIERRVEGIKLGVIGVCVLISFKKKPIKHGRKVKVS